MYDKLFAYYTNVVTETQQITLKATKINKPKPN